MNVLRLGGCTLEPLGSYLKALSVLRLVSEQADGSARGWWDGGSFCVETELDEGGLVAFFLERYTPTPILSPWNGGSGFYPKDRKVGIQAIAGSTGERFNWHAATGYQTDVWSGWTRRSASPRKMRGPLRRFSVRAAMKAGWTTPKT